MKPLLTFMAFLLCGSLFSQTQLKIFNSTPNPVTVWITLGATKGCLQNVKDIPFITFGSGLQGSFVLKGNDSTIAYAPLGMGWNGNISFETPPINCATTQFPNGVNIFEFIINNAFQPGNPQETIDISCVAGVNCGIGVITSGSKWNASTMYSNVKYFANGNKKHNSGRVGVYPFGCDVCTASQSPPPCDKSDKDKQKFPICNVQRNASNNGGVIKIIYNK